MGIHILITIQEASITPCLFSTQRYTHHSTKMKVILSIILALYLVVTLAQAGCNQYGCCWCGSQTGRIIYTGSRAPRCNPGFHCDCGYNHYTRTYYGTCDPDDNFARAFPGGK